MRLVRSGMSRATPGPRVSYLLLTQPTEIPAFAGMTPWLENHSENYRFTLTPTDTVCVSLSGVGGA